MEFRQLRYFVAVAEELSFTRAAIRLKVSQPPLSMHIKALEEELGTSLFARNRRKVALTPAGAVLLDQARGALDKLDLAGEMVRRTVRGEAGRLLIGFTSSVPLLPLFAQLLRRFRRMYPDAAVEAVLMSTGQQLDSLEAGTLDVGILRPPAWFKAASNLSVLRLWRNELHVFLADDHPLLAPGTSITPASLASEPFISFASDIGCGLVEHTAVICSQAGFRPRIDQEVTVASSILGLIAAGAGVSILPACHARAGVAGVASRPLAAPDTTSDLLLAHRGGDRNPLLRRFLDVVATLAPTEP